MYVGSWYSADSRVLDKQLSEWLLLAKTRGEGEGRVEEAGLPRDARALIVPHAGYAYSGGSVAAWLEKYDSWSIKNTAKSVFTFCVLV